MLINIAIITLEFTAAAPRSMHSGNTTSHMSASGTVISNSAQLYALQVLRHPPRVRWPTPACTPAASRCVATDACHSHWTDFYHNNCQHVDACLIADSKRCPPNLLEFKNLLQKCDYWMFHLIMNNPHHPPPHSSANASTTNPQHRNTTISDIALTTVTLTLTATLLHDYTGTWYKTVQK